MVLLCILLRTAAAAAVDPAGVPAEAPGILDQSLHSPADPLLLLLLLLRSPTLRRCLRSEAASIPRVTEADQLRPFSNTRVELRRRGQRLGVQAEDIRDARAQGLSSSPRALSAARPEVWRSSISDTTPAIPIIIIPDTPSTLQGILIIRSAAQDSRRVFPRNLIHPILRPPVCRPSDLAGVCPARAEP